MRKYFTKELANNPFQDRHGNPVPFEVFPSNVGIIDLDSEKDAELIADLQDAASKRKGGIVPVTEEEWNEIKKNRGGSRVSAAFQPPTRLQAMRSPTVFRAPNPVPSPAASPAAANPQNGHSVPPLASSTPNLDGKSTAPVKRPASRRKSEAESKAPSSPPQ